MFHFAHSKCMQVGEQQTSWTKHWLKGLLSFPYLPLIAAMQSSSPFFRWVGEQGSIFPPREEKKGSQQRLSPWVCCSARLLFFPSTLQDPHWLPQIEFQNRDYPWQASQSLPIQGMDAVLCHSSSWSFVRPWLPLTVDTCGWVQRGLSPLGPSVQSTPALLGSLASQHCPEGV